MKMLDYITIMKGIIIAVQKIAGMLDWLDEKLQFLGLHPHLI
jgi:hypothetical protein